MNEHIPVLLTQVLECFSGIKIERFLDGTLGFGGHAKALLNAHPEILKYYGIDQDEHALKRAQEIVEDPRLKALYGRFDVFDELITEPFFEGMLFDLGVSSWQLDQPDRGFSFSKEGPLDMRMDQNRSLSAKDVVNTFSEKQLGEIFRDYGEEPRWRRAARVIVEERRKKTIETTLELSRILSRELGALRGKKIHPHTLVFQGLRIFVNQELEVIHALLPKAFNALNVGGRLAVITFHSLEDRIVKHAFREHYVKTRAIKILTKKPIEAEIQEKRHNPRARSAKLRIIEKVCV